MLLMILFYYMMSCLESKNIMKHKHSNWVVLGGRGVFASHWQILDYLKWTAAPGLIINDPFPSTSYKLTNF